MGLRRARTFAEAGAHVVVVARELRGEAPQGVDVVLADLRRMDYTRLLARADIAVIAVDDQDLAAEVAEAARRVGALVNDATDASRADVVVPYRARVGGVELAATSGGAAGAAARIALEVAERCLEGSHVPTLFKAYARAKEEAKRAIRDVRRRLQFYDALIRDEEFMRRVALGDVDAAVARALELLRNFV